MFKHSWMTLPAIVAIAFLGAAQARASVTYSLQSVTSFSPGTGSFEVDLTNTGAAAVEVFSFNFGLTMPNSNFTITAANCSTTMNAYIFVPATNSLFCPALNSSVLPGTTVNAGDVWIGAGNGVSVAAGATVGIGEILFSVAGGVTPGAYTVSFITSDDSVSNIAGATLGPINDSGTGTIDVAAPEPSTMALFAVALFPLIWIRKRARS